MTNFRILKITALDLSKLFLQTHLYVVKHKGQATKEHVSIHVRTKTTKTHANTTTVWGFARAAHYELEQAVATHTTASMKPAI